MTTPLRLEIDTRDTDQTVAVGRVIGACCKPGDVIALEGELGAGKTQLVRGLADGLGLDPRQVSSPTFVLMQEYEPGDDAVDQPALFHIDAYRIKSEDDLISIGWHGEGEELREDAVLAIEWASLIEPALGPDLLRLKIAHEQAGRRITLTGQGDWQDRMQGLRVKLDDSDLATTQVTTP